MKAERCAVFSMDSDDDARLRRWCAQAMKELNAFFGLSWKRNLPRVIIVKDRKTIDMLQKVKTARWLVGWLEGGSESPPTIYVLDKDNYERDSSHKYSDSEYYKLIKHELAHLFRRSIADGHLPSWVNEGIAVYASGQLRGSAERPKRLSKFLSYYYAEYNRAYIESGLAIKYLVEKYGKKKLLALIRLAKSGIEVRKEFDIAFERIYGFKPTYAAFAKA